MFVPAAAKATVIGAASNSKIQMPAQQVHANSRHVCMPDGIGTR